MGVVEVGMFTGNDDGTGDISAGLIGVKRDGLPPLSNRRRRRSTTGIGGGNGEEKVLD